MCRQKIPISNIVVKPVIIMRFLLCMLVAAFPLVPMAKVQAPIEVSIKGDIAEPGTYKLGQGDGLCDLISKAGGLTFETVNQPFAVRVNRPWGDAGVYCSYSLYSNELLSAGHDIRLEQDDAVILQVEQGAEPQSGSVKLQEFIKRQPKDFYRLIDFPYLRGLNQPTVYYPISRHEKKVLFSTKLNELLLKRELIKTGSLVIDGEYLIFTAGWDDHHLFRNQLERAKKFAKTVDPSDLDISIVNPFSVALKEKERRESQEREQSLARKAWKDESIAAIREQLKKHPAPTLKEGQWHTAEWIIFEDGDWMAYRYADGGHPWHENYAGFPNLFIGCDSKGDWHYSNDHFCVGLSAYKHMHGQPKDLDEFIEKGYLALFDGMSDQALKSTRPPPSKMERRM